MLSILRLIKNNNNYILLPFDEMNDILEELDEEDEGFIHDNEDC